MSWNVWLLSTSVGLSVRSIFLSASSFASEGMLGLSLSIAFLNLSIRITSLYARSGRCPQQNGAGRRQGPVVPDRCWP